MSGDDKTIFNLFITKVMMTMMVVVARSEGSVVVTMELFKRQENLCLGEKKGGRRL